ncbi:hypothetical protein MG296_10605 [Flavobacteriaceae bacterium TK19130]|nr:hypothetical protein [Thermobacterium salinum]
MNIQEWFKDQDYNTGVELYASSPNAKNRILSVLNRGYSSRNMSLLIKELRALKNTKNPPKKTLRTSKKPKHKAPVIPQKEAEDNHKKSEAAKLYFKKVKYGELPPKLKVRFRKLKDLFYDLCDLKFELNELPPEKEEEALDIQIKIDAIDSQKDTIWKEIDHWQEFKTFLPDKVSIDFSSLSDIELERKRQNLENYIRKKNGRIEKWKNELSDIDDKNEAKKIMRQIDRTQRDVHQHEIDVRKIEDIFLDRL